MSTVYLVWETEGDLNLDYLEEVFETKALAEKFVELQCQGDYWVEEKTVRGAL